MFFWHSHDQKNLLITMVLDKVEKKHFKKKMLYSREIPTYIGSIKKCVILERSFRKFPKKSAVFWKGHFQMAEKKCVILEQKSGRYFGTPLYLILLTVSISNTQVEIIKLHISEITTEFYLFSEKRFIISNRVHILYVNYSH